MSIEFKSIEDFAIVISGYAFKSEWFGIGNDKVIRIGDLQDNLINTDSALTVDAKLHKVSDNFKIRNNDILIALSGATVGKIAIASTKDIDAYINQRVAIIRANNPITASYLKFFFSGKYLDELLKNAGGAAQPNLSPKQLLLMKIPLPPLEEQRRIADILDKADSLIQKRKEAIAKLDELLQATFIDMFGDPVTNPKGWECYYLKDLCIKITVGIVVKPASYYVDEGIPALRSLNIGINQIITENFVYFSPHDNDTTLSKTKLKFNDVVIVRSGQPGKAAVIPKELEGINAIDVLIVRTKESVLTPLFLSFFLNSNAGKQLVMKEQRGQVQKHLNVTQLAEAYLPTPPVSLQDTFLQKINFIEKQKQAMQAQLETQETLFKALQQQAFSGQL